MNRNVRTVALLCYRARQAIRSGDPERIGAALARLDIALDTLTGEEPGFGGLAKLTRGINEAIGGGVRLVAPTPAND